ncbi:MAG: glycosyl hydrolase 53 family protein [Thermoguttaceae bacterium]|nr:glycosyl hydrolase 53 family protein [Thermoguttaceae bacterium]
MKYRDIFIAFIFVVFCSESFLGQQNVEKSVSASAHTDADFAYGGDISWVTAMEKQGKTFVNASGEAADCFELLSSIGMNAARFRVFVNPSEWGAGVWGLCDIDDVVTKSIRAQKAGMKIMIDFHYSDTWADPSHQKKPAAWDNIATVEDLSNCAAAFTRITLERLKAAGVDVAWVQIGNETRGGMMTTSSTGKSTDVNGSMGNNYVVIHNRCAFAARRAFPHVKIVTHFENGQSALGEKQIAVLKKLDFDIFGLSLYPEYVKQGEYWAPDVNGISEKQYKNCAENMNAFATEFGKETMICEIGVTNIETPSNGATLKVAYDYIKSNVPSCKGVFYWEPECYSGFNHYSMGGFTSSGQPAPALIDIFNH